MTNYFPFVQPVNAQFQFQPTLDGQVYNCIASWSLYGRRNYLNCYSLSGTLIFSIPIIGSPAGINIQSATWSNGYNNGVATIVLQSALSYPVGTTFKITLSGMSPATWNGEYVALMVNSTTFTFLQPVDPGLISILGLASQDISITDGYFTSTMVYRESTNTFEVSP